MTEPGPAAPSLAVWAVRLWMASGVLFLASAAWFLIIGIGSTNALGIGLGVVSAGVGVGMLLLTRRTGSGDPRWRSVLAVLSLTVSVLGMLMAALFLDPFLLISGIVGLVGSMMAYRPAAEPWFTRGGVGG